jgi:hypothetical protein
MSEADFGITISCYRGDLPLLNGCLASLREHLADIPVCLIKHGHFDTEVLSRLYGVTSLEQSDVRQELRDFSYGYGVTKMVSFWDGPFERFIHVDADTIVWGDPFKGLPVRDFDLIYNEPHEEITENIQREQYFDPSKLFPPLVDFGWRNQPYFNTGVFCAKRGIFDLKDYLEILDIQRDIPGSFFTDQGILNFMTFKGVAEGRLRVREWPFQTLTPLHSREDLSRRFAFRSGVPLVKEDDRRVIHWAGPKPLLRQSRDFDEPMTHYRLAHLAKTRPLLRPFGRGALLLEEIWARIELRYGGNLLRALASKLGWWLERIGQRVIRARKSAISETSEPRAQP